MGSIARNFDIGAQIHEKGINTFNARVYHAKPGLFERYQEIVVQPATGRKLILYLFVTEPIAFDFYPAAQPEVRPDQFHVQLKAEFTLTDELPLGAGLGLIAKVGVTLEAIVGLDHTDLEIFPVIKQFKVTNLVARSPYPPTLSPSGALDFGPSLTGAEAGGGQRLSTADAFAAILNYLISVYLETYLRSAIRGAPMPQIAVGTNTGFALTLRGMSVENDRLSVYLRDSPGGLEPVALGPAPLPDPAHLAVGAVERIVNRTLSAMLPISLPVKSDCPGTSMFEMQESILTIPTASFEFEVLGLITAHVFLTGNLLTRLNATVLGYDMHIDVKIPLGPPTQVYGTVMPFVKDNGDGTFDVMVRPTIGFFKQGYVIIATDWRHVFQEEAKNWVRAHVSPILTWIPLVGWIVAKGVEEIAGAVAAYLGLMLLDLPGTFFLTGVGTLAWNLIARWFGEKWEQRAYRFDTNKLLPGVPLGVRQISNPRIELNAERELVVEMRLHPEPSPSPLPAPEIPGPIPVAAKPDAPPCSPAPPDPYIPPSLPAYADGAFQPALRLSGLAWTDGLSLVYEVENTAPNGNKTKLVRRALFHLVSGPDRWRLVLQTETPDGLVSATSSTYFDTGFNLLSEESSSVIQVGESTVPVHYLATYVTGVRSVTAEGQIGARQVNSRSFPMPSGAVQFVAAETWPFRLMANDLQEDSSGNFACSDITLGGDYTNWTRFVPQTVRVLGVDDLVIGGQVIETLKVMVSGEGTIATMWVERVGRQLLRWEQRCAGYQCVMEIRK